MTEPDSYFTERQSVKDTKIYELEDQIAALLQNNIWTTSSQLILYFSVDFQSNFYYMVQLYVLKTRPAKYFAIQKTFWWDNARGFQG